MFKPYAAGAGVLVLLLAGIPILAVIAALALTGLGLYVYVWDRERRSPQLHYDLEDPEIGVRLAMANQAGHSLGSATMMWQGADAILITRHSVLLHTQPHDTPPMLRASDQRG